MLFGFSDEQTVLRPGIIKNHSDLSKEEWLERMQKKSAAQGKPLTWRQIKDDPDLDHEQISLKLGPYTIYENRLFCSVHQNVQSTECLRGMVERNYMAAKIYQNRATFAKAEPLIDLYAPEKDITLWNPRYIIAGNLEKADSKKWLSSYKLEFIDCLQDINRVTLRRVFRGESKAYCISRAVVYPDSIRFTVRRTGLPSTDVQTVQEIIMTVRPKMETRLFLGITRHDAKEYDGYAICSCKNTDKRTSIEILHQQQLGAI